MRKIILLLSVFAALTAAGQTPGQPAGKGPSFSGMTSSFSGMTSSFSGRASSFSGQSPSIYVVPERRETPIRWYDSLPVSPGRPVDYAVSPFALQAQPGEYFVFQLGVWSTGSIDIRVFFSDFRNALGKTLHKEAITCFNAGGIDYQGHPFRKPVRVLRDRAQALWIGIDLSNAARGSYSGTATVVAGKIRKQVRLQLDIAGESVVELGTGDGYRLSRMAWLNSKAGIDDSITKGYLPVSVTRHVTKPGQDVTELNILGRSFRIAPNGLPGVITSYFTPSNEGIGDRGEPVTDAPFRFVIEREGGEPVRLRNGVLKITKTLPGSVSWEVHNSAPECELIVSGRLEYDGYVGYKLSLRPHQRIRVKDIRMEVPMNAKKAVYMMGLGREGGIAPERWDWKWDTIKHQDAVWLGGVNGGLQIKWKDDQYRLPLVNIYYEFGRLHLPSSWGNRGQGGVTIGKTVDGVGVNAYSGSRQLTPGETCHYDFDLLITPFRTIDKDIKYGDRYYHGGGPESFTKIDKALNTGANIINIHQAESIYPFINYPYLDDNISDWKKLTAIAHSDSLRLKPYYTTREITKNMPEFFAFYSLNGEVIYPGPGNESRTVLHPDGASGWLKDNLREKYIPAWFDSIKSGKFAGVTDISVITTPESRMNNFYIGGLDWMLRNLSIDGVYIDDAAIDRFTIRRARKLIDRYRPAGRMDMHSWNHFNKWAGYASCLNLYMDLLPYLDLVWIGEGRDYDRMPDHWLVEVSGIPFGLPGQMLEGGGNAWRGMVYGITNRAGWSGNPPTEIWKFWDVHTLKEKELIGYWDDRCPVTTDNDSIKVSLYKGRVESVLAIGNWSQQKQTGAMRVDWSRLGYDPPKISISVPAIPGFQEKQEVGRTPLPQSISIPGGKGLLIVIRKE